MTGVSLGSLMAILALSGAGATTDPVPPTTATVDSSKVDFGVTAKTELPAIRPAEPLNGGVSHTSTVPVVAAQPPCGSGLSVGTCTPVTTCEPDAGSPTGFRLVTAWGSSGGNGDFTIGEPCEPAEADQAARPSLPALVLRAFQRVPLPEPQLSIQPPKGKTLVGLETIFSTKAEPFTRTLTLLGRQVQLKIEPSSFTWHHGDETTQSTDWPGKAWRNDQPDIDTYITHVFEHTGTVRPGVEVTWSAEYRVGNGPWQDVNGTVSRTSPRATLQVVEGEPVLHGY